MTKSTRNLVWVSIVLILFIWIHAGKEIYHTFWPIEHWVEYLEVSPLADYVLPGATLYMQSNTNVYREVDMEFNDILHCLDNDGEWLRFSEQNTSRHASQPELDRLTPWPYSPIPNHETDCYVESNITLVFDNGIRRSIRYDGLEHDKIVKVRE